MPESLVFVLRLNISHSATLTNQNRPREGSDSIILEKAEVGVPFHVYLIWCLYSAVHVKLLRL